MADNKNNEGHAGAPFSPPHGKFKPGRPPRRAPTLDTVIGQKMRAMYDDLLHQPVPDRLVEILRQLDKAQENNSR